MIVGVYGGIASGKTVLMEAMKEHGFCCLDCDEIIRWLFAHTESENGADMKAAILERFGMVYDDGVVNPHKLGDQVREDLDARADLDAITTGYTRREVLCRASKYQDEGGRLLATDAVQTLWHVGEWPTDCNVRVVAPTFLRILRLRKRDGLSLREAERRVTLLDARNHAAEGKDIRYVLHNDDDFSVFRKACDTFLKERETFGW